MYYFCDFWNKNGRFGGSNWFWTRTCSSVPSSAYPSEPDLSPIRGSEFWVKKPNGTRLRQHYCTEKHLNSDKNHILIDPNHSTTLPSFFIHNLCRQVKLKMWLRQLHCTEKHLGWDLDHILNNLNHCTILLIFLPYRLGRQVGLEMWTKHLYCSKRLLSWDLDHILNDYLHLIALLAFLTSNLEGQARRMSPEIHQISSTKWH